MIRREKILLPVAVVATGGFAGTAQAQVTYQPIGLVATTTPQDVVIGNNGGTPQYTYGIEPFPLGVKYSPAQGTSFTNPVPMSSATITPNGATSTLSIKPDATTGSDTFYQIRFDIGGITQDGYAQFSPDANTLIGVGYQAAAITAAPEPAAWAQMVLGFGVVGAATRTARRRRRRQLANA